MKSATVRRFDRTADLYKRWWAPVLAPKCADLIDRLTELERRAAREPIEVLDVGCGTGNLLFEAVARWPRARITGLDASDGMLAVAERERAALSPEAAGRISFVAADAAETPFDDASFDVVMSAFVVQQVPDRPAVLRELRRLLRPDGLLGIYGWLNTGYVFEPDKEMEAALTDAGVNRPASTEVRAGHYASADQAVDELREAGFEDVDGVPGNLAHAWAPDDLIDYHINAHDIDLVDVMTSDQKRVFRESWRRRLTALPVEALVYRAPVIRLTARAR